MDDEHGEGDRNYNKHNITSLAPALCSAALNILEELWCYELPLHVFLQRYKTYMPLGNTRNQVQKKTYKTVKTPNIYNI